MEEDSGGPNEACSATVPQSAPRELGRGRVGGMEEPPPVHQFPPLPRFLSQPRITPLGRGSLALTAMTKLTLFSSPVSQHAGGTGSPARERSHCGPAPAACREVRRALSDHLVCDAAPSESTHSHRIQRVRSDTQEGSFPTLVGLGHGRRPMPAPEHLLRGDGHHCSCRCAPNGLHELCRVGACRPPTFSGRRGPPGGGGGERPPPCQRDGTDQAPCPRGSCR